ncbi:MAG: YczE/YyaS/YitT family protein, partial [Brevundimonas sp.]
GAGLGPGPRDGLMTGIVARTGWPVKWVRTSIELAVIAVGWLLGGSVGLGTVLYAVTIGPLVHVFLPMFTIRPKTTD